MIKRFSPNNAARFRQNSLRELNEATAAMDGDIQQIVDEVDALEAVTPAISFDAQKGVVITPGVSITANTGTETEG